MIPFSKIWGSVSWPMYSNEVEWALSAMYRKKYGARRTFSYHKTRGNERHSLCVHFSVMITKLERIDCRPAVFDCLWVTIVREFCHDKVTQPISILCSVTIVSVITCNASTCCSWTPRQRSPPSPTLHVRI